jgi:hypothetical protein
MWQVRNYRRKLHASGVVITASAHLACGGVGGGDGPLLDQLNRVHYRVINHVSPFTVQSVVDTAILRSIWTTGPQRFYDSTPGQWRYVGSGAPCEIGFVRYANRTTDVYLYQDSMFPVVYITPPVIFTQEAISLMSQYANDPEDPIELREKVLKAFVVPHVAERTAEGSVVTGNYLGWAGSTPSHDVFPAIYLGSARIAQLGRWTTFAHEVSHLLAPPPGWRDNDTDFTSILTYPGEYRYDWDEGSGQLIWRPATDQSVRTIIDVNGKSQCDAAWTSSYVRVLTDTVLQ